jgi:signal peptidase II
VSFRYRLFAVTSAIVLILDQASKFYIDSHFRLYESVTVIENFFQIVHVRNQGAAFGFLAESSFRLPFFITVALVAAGAIIWYLHHSRVDQRLLQFALSLVFAGAIGNLIDRIRLGEVIDFLDVHWYYQYHWPAFNVADSAITVGVTLLLIDVWREERRLKKQNQSGSLEG